MVKTQDFNASKIYTKNSLQIPEMTVSLSPVMALPKGFAELGKSMHKASTSFLCMYMRHVLFIFLHIQRAVGRRDRSYSKMRKPRI